MSIQATLRAANIARQEEWSKGQDTPALFKATELGGEVGEALNVVKKLERERLGMVGSRASVDHLAEELADIIICTDLLAMHYGIDLDLAVARKFNATSDKVGMSTRMAVRL